jgi:DNA (cytosine-5)-methyltransferase 1
MKCPDCETLLIRIKIEKRFRGDPNKKGTLPYIERWQCPFCRLPPTGYGKEMLKEFGRCVTEAQPEWWLMENVATVPDVKVPGWTHQRLDINNAWFSDSSRLRHIQFGSKSHRFINVTRLCITKHKEPAVLANDDRDFATICQLQGLSKDFDLPSFLMKEKKRAVGNGVPLPMGLTLAQAVIDAYTDCVTLQQKFDGTMSRPDLCECGCGRCVSPSSKYAVDQNGSTTRHRKTAQQKHDLAKSQARK